MFKKISQIRKFGNMRTFCDLWFGKISVLSRCNSASLGQPVSPKGWDVGLDDKVLMTPMQMLALKKINIDGSFRIKNIWKVIVLKSLIEFDSSRERERERERWSRERERWSTLRFSVRLSHKEEKWTDTLDAEKEEQNLLILLWPQDIK